MILLDNSMTNTVLLFIVVGMGCFLIGLVFGHVLRRADTTRGDANTRLADVHKSLHDMNTP
jgi:hypothetical protein